MASRKGGAEWGGRMDVAGYLKKAMGRIHGAGRDCPENADGKLRIRAERDSVCMGDDCDAPNTRYLDYGPDERLSEFMDSVANYVPLMREAVWSVTWEGRTIAYLVFDEKGDHLCELAVPDGRVSELAGKRIYCRYYHRYSLLDHKAVPPAELYPECGTLLEKVKIHERKAEEGI